MKREEPRTGRIADFEFQFWECWESDDSVPGAPERHWFRSDTGLEAPTYDHMLQMLYRQKMGLLVTQPPTNQPQPSCTSEWDKRTCHTVRVRGEDVPITICEHFTEASGGAPVSTKIIGPNGLITSSYPEMLERLGIGRETQHSAEKKQSAVSTQHSAKAKSLPSAVRARQAAAAENENSDPALVISQHGKLIAPSAPEPLISVVEDAQQAVLQPSAVSASDTEQSASGGPPQKQELQSVVDLSRANLNSARIDRRSGPVVASPNGKSESERLCPRDAKDMEEAKTRGEEFEKRHPWLWEDPDEEAEEPINSMRLVWWGEYIKTVYPELATAALDSARYEAYIQNYDYAKPIPLNESDEKGEQQVGAEAPRCQYIKADGERCGCPALKRKRLCYFHSKTADGRKRRKNASADPQPDRSSDLEVPVLENDRAIQMAVTNICRQLAKDGIEPKRASTLLYGLHVAAVAVRRTTQKGSGSIF